MTESQENKQYLIGIRSHLSTQYLFSAWSFTKHAKSIEDKYTSEEDLKTFFLDHRSSVLGCIIITVTFLEAYINEFFSDISANMLFDYPNISKECAEKLSLLWEHGIPRTAKYSILEKYEFALGKLSGKEFNKGISPYQDVKMLIKLRNSLIHFESEWVYNDPNKFGKKDLEHELEKSLKGKFQLNPITGSANPFFPDKCLGFGICRWGLSSSIKFVLDFWKLSNITPQSKDSIAKVNALVQAI